MRSVQRKSDPLQCFLQDVVHISEDGFQNIGLDFYGEYGGKLKMTAEQLMLVYNAWAQEKGEEGKSVGSLTTLIGTRGEEKTGISRETRASESRGKYVFDIQKMKDIHPSYNDAGPDGELKNGEHYRELARTYFYE